MPEEENKKTEETKEERRKRVELDYESTVKKARDLMKSRLKDAEQEAAKARKEVGKAFKALEAVINSDYLRAKEAALDSKRADIEAIKLEPSNLILDADIKIKPEVRSRIG